MAELQALGEREAKIVRDLSSKFLAAIRAVEHPYESTVQTAALVSAAGALAAANAASIDDRPEEILEEWIATFADHARQYFAAITADGKRVIALAAGGSRA